MRWLTSIGQIRSEVTLARQSGRTVGLVPTMGNLHAGHASLLRRARNETGFVVATLFVNPTQFGPKEDFQRYPRTPEQDRELCEGEGVDAVFAPEVATMYDPGARTTVRVAELDEVLCGPFRPGHFVGVATVVCKLFNIIPADRAYFGRKDYQQAKLIQRMAKDLDFPIEVHLVETVREEDGLAMSSRNAYLDARERAEATVLFQALEEARRSVSEGERNARTIREAMTARVASAPRARIEYIEIVDPETLQALDRVDARAVAALAVRFGATRLIDNADLIP